MPGGFYFPILTRGLDGDIYGISVAYEIKTIFKISSAGIYSKVWQEVESTHFWGYYGDVRGYEQLTLGSDGALYLLAHYSSRDPWGNNPERFRAKVLKIQPDTGTASSLSPAIRVFREGDYLSTTISSLPPLLLGSDGGLYGVAENDGMTVDYDYSFEGPPNKAGGMVFRVDADGVFTRLSDFNSLGHRHVEDPGSDPNPALTRGSDGALYGTVEYGGDHGVGEIYRVAVDGRHQTLHSFRHSDGATPRAALTLGPDGALYGTTYHGGAENVGTIFRLGQDGAFTTLHSFTAAEGALPVAGLALGRDGAFYGVTARGGATKPYGDLPSACLDPNAENAFLEMGSAPGCGTLYRITPGGVFTLLHHFDQASGFWPVTTLTEGSDGALYGSTTHGGSASGGHGTVFRIGTDDTFTTMHTFQSLDGEYPKSVALGSDGALYGVTATGGGGGLGILYRIAVDGRFSVVHEFTAGSDGSEPRAQLVLGGDGALYGTTAKGGADDRGTLFRVTPAGEFVSVHQFSTAEGWVSPVTLARGADGSLHGTTYYGEESGGSWFMIDANGVFQQLEKLQDWDAVAHGQPLTAGDGYVLYGRSLRGGSQGGGAIFHLRRTLTAKVTIQNKTYDGNTGAIIKVCALSPMVKGVTCDTHNASASFANANVGTGKTVTITGLSLQGDERIYLLASSTVTAKASITKANTVTTLAVSPNPSIYGQKVTLTAKVTRGEAAAGGQVRFLEGSKVLATKALSKGETRYSITSLFAGSHPLTAQFLGAANYNASVSSAILLTVDKAEQAPLTVKATPASIVVGKTSTLSATGGTGPGALTYAATPSGSAVCTITANKLKASGGAGSCAVTATRAASANYRAVTSAPVPVAVIKAENVLSSSANTSTYGQALTFTAVVTGVNPTGTILFMEGATLKATKPLVAGTARYSVTTLSAGSHTLVAKYSGNANNPASSSNPVTVEIAKATQAPLTVIATPTSLLVGKTATLSANGGTGPGALSYAAVPSGSTVCTITANKLKASGGAGSCAVTATRAASANYLVVTSPAVSVPVTMP